MQTLGNKKKDIMALNHHDEATIWLEKILEKLHADLRDLENVVSQQAKDHYKLEIEVEKFSAIKKTLQAIEAQIEKIEKTLAGHKKKITILALGLGGASGYLMGWEKIKSFCQKY